MNHCVRIRVHDEAREVSIKAPWKDEEQLLFTKQASMGSSPNYAMCAVVPKEAALELAREQLLQHRAQGTSSQEAATVASAATTHGGSGAAEK